MSLLLDALKKAAEKKAKKNAEDKASADSTLIDSDSTAASTTQSRQADDTDVSATAQMYTETELDRTEVDSTQLDDEALDQTQLDNTEIDNIQFNQTSVEQTEIEATEVDQTSVEQTEIEATEVDQTSVEQAVIEAAEVDQTQVDNTEMDRTDVNEPRFDTTHLDTTQVDSTEYDDTSPSLPNDDRTMFIYSDDEDDATGITSIDLDEKTETTDIYAEDRFSADEDETESLTDDDVTEFMGDGLTADEITDRSSELEGGSRYASDDTTITNTDSLSLTNFGYEDLSLEEQEDTGYQLAEDSTQTVTSSMSAYDGRLPPEGSDDQGLSLEDIDEEDDVSTIVHPDIAAKAIDVEKLTNDETVTIKETTGTRTFAPDNYDRTLLKLAESDTSKIFPGMKPESDTVMTPDYAKKIFLNKSQGVKTHYYKIYAGLAVLILLAVSIWGLTQVQQELETIDNSLVRLKRDPMPGVIKPRQEEQSQSLFVDSPIKVDEKVQNLIAKVDDPAGVVDAEPLDQQAPMQTEQSPQIEPADSDGTLSESEGTIQPSQNQVAATEADAVDEPVAESDQQTEPPTQAEDEAQSIVSAQQPESDGLRISTSSRVDEKDQVLVEAYQAYEQGDDRQARQLYDRVLSMDAGNRDAMLGRAALHVRNSELDLAITAYQKLLEANPKDSVAMTSLLSVINIDPQVGETRVKGLLREQPDSPYLHFALGNMYGSQHRWDEAQVSYFTALQYRPGDPNYAYNLAVSLEHLEKPGSAITFYQRALDNLSNTGLVGFDSQVVSQRIEVLSQ